MATVLDLPRIPLARSPRVITIDIPTRWGTSLRTHVAAVWGELENVSSVIVQPLSSSITTDEQTWRSSIAKTNSLTAGLGDDTALVQWLGRTIASTSERSHHPHSDVDPIDRDAASLLEFDVALRSALPRSIGHTYLGYGAGGYLIAEACKRGLAPSAVAFVDTPGLGRQARRHADGTPMIDSDILIHARETITCMRELNPALTDIPVLVLGGGGSEVIDDELMYASPPQHLADVIVATTHGDDAFQLLPRTIAPAQLRRYVFAAQQRRATTSGEAQRNLHAFLNGQLHLIRVANRLGSADAKPTPPGIWLLRVPAVPLFSREHTGDNAPRCNTRPRIVRSGGPRPPSKPDGYHTRAAEDRY
ncbi:MAG: hypothetical protein ACRDPW_01615 [Mycobacteriales bacterium]